MGKVPIRLKEITYVLSPFEQSVMSGLTKDLGHKAAHHVANVRGRQQGQEGLARSSDGCRAVAAAGQWRHSDSDWQCGTHGVRLMCFMSPAASGRRDFRRGSHCWHRLVSLCSQAAHQRSPQPDSCCCFPRMPCVCPAFVVALCADGD